jgi:hypothetical protein
METMASKPFAAGDIIAYPYRWAAEAAEDRSIDGAKERPCCLVIRLLDGTLIFLAISSKPPGADQEALEVPQIERRRAGLGKYPQAWIYIGESNRDADLGLSWYLEPQKPMGSFSPAFLATVRRAFRESVARGGIVVSRTT